MAESTVGGWKTITGSILFGIGTVLTTMPPLFDFQHDLGQMFLGIGGALMGVGIAHKIEKAAGK